MTKEQMKTGIHKAATGIQNAVKMQDVPTEKWYDILKRVVFGALLGGLGFFGTTQDWDHWVTGALFAGAGYNISRQLAVNTAKAIYEGIKKLIQLIAFKNGGADPDA